MKKSHDGQSVASISRECRLRCEPAWQDKFTKRSVGWAVEERMTEEPEMRAFSEGGERKWG